MPVMFEGPSDLELARADLEALRAKARAVCEASSEIPDDGDLLPITDYLVPSEEYQGLRAELDKPSGASLAGERDAAYKARDAAILARVVVELERDRFEDVADAWKALAKALGDCAMWQHAIDTEGRSDERARGLTASMRAVTAAIAALRALGIDPEAK